MGVVVRRYIYIDILTVIINFPYSTCISFFGSSIPTSLFIFKIFFCSLYVPSKLIAAILMLPCNGIYRGHIYINNKMANYTISYIESVDSIRRDERGFPLTQYITNR